MNSLKQLLTNSLKRFSINFDRTTGQIAAELLTVTFFLVTMFNMLFYFMPIVLLVPFLSLDAVPKSGRNDGQRKAEVPAPYTAFDKRLQSRKTEAEPAHFEKLEEN